MSVEESCFIKAGKLVRPFTRSALVRSRSCSLPLQRVIADFGADGSFRETVNKIKEHYGIEISHFAARKVTEQHALEMTKFKGKVQKGEKIVISQTDGSMVPIVETTPSKDKRKSRKILWKEVKLSFARGEGSLKRFYAGVIGSAEEAGKKMLECALLAGMQEGTHVHAIGDGAPWILDQFKLKFCNRGHYLIDFFHACEYLSKASIWCNPSNKDSWLKESKEKLKNGKEKEILEELKNRIEILQVEDNESGIIQCYRYMEKRLEHMNDKSILDKQLPIGSGEIESSHRTVVQKRLKIPGAWWKEENAHAMLQLRINRFNGYWEDYWQAQKFAA
jgi:hypothetical protein